MSGQAEARVTGFFAGLGMAVLVAVHIAFLAAFAAVVARLMPIAVPVGAALSPWLALAAWTAGVGYGGFWAARGGLGRWWPTGLAVGTAAAMLTVAVRWATSGLPSGGEGGLVLVLCESAALVGAALGRRVVVRPIATAVLARVLATDTFLLFGAVFLICVTITAGYPGQFKNLTRAEAWVLALLSGLPAGGAMLSLRATGGLRQSLLRQTTGIAALVLLAGFAAALGLRAYVNEHSAVTLHRAAAGFDAAHATADGAAVEALLNAARQVEAGRLSGPRPDILLTPAGWDNGTFPDLARELDDAQKVLDKAVESSKALTGYLPLTAELKEQSGAPGRPQEPLAPLVQALCASALRADVGYGQALARIDAAHRIAVSARFQSVLTQAHGTNEEVVLVSLKRLLAQRQLDAKAARDTLNLLAGWDKRRQVVAGTWGALARLAAAQVIVHGYVKDSRESVVSYLVTFWLSPASRQEAVDPAVDTFTADMVHMQPAEFLQRYGRSAYLDRVMEDLVHALAGRAGRSLREMQNAGVEAGSLGTVADGLSAYWADGARLHLLAGGLALRLEGQRTGRLPDKLEVVAAGCPVLLQDPFAGAPLCLGVRDGATVIFSVGPNGRSDDGAGAFSTMEQAAPGQAGGQSRRPDDILLPLDSIPPLAR